MLTLREMIEYMVLEDIIVRYNENVLYEGEADSREIPNYILNKYVTHIGITGEPFNSITLILAN